MFKFRTLPIQISHRWQINNLISILVALIVFIHALLFLGADIKSPQLLIKLLNFSLLLLLMIPLCINSLVSYAKIFPVMFFLIESITLLKISLILILFCLNLNISKCSLTLYYTIKLSFVKELLWPNFTWWFWLSMTPQNKLDKRHFYSALRDIELLRDSIILHLKLPKHKKVHNFS